VRRFNLLALCGRNHLPGFLRFANLTGIGLGMKVAGVGGREIYQDPLAANLEIPKVVLYHSANSVKASPLPAIDEWRLQLPNQHVFKKRERAARLQQALVGPKDFPHLDDGKIVDRQAGNDEIIDSFARQVLQVRVNDLEMVAVVPEDVLLFNPAPEQVDKTLVDLDEIELIARLELPKDFPRDGTSARANLQDSGWAARLAKFRS
jgi:hypothetical protein